jgi:cytoskeletal protein RodZ
MAELGNTLSRARRARGITLEDAERDTHVSRRYLQALEIEDFNAFPAPVYARGFLRTYSRYLGLNPDELMRVFPNGDLAVDITPLPTVSRPPSPMVNVNWVVAGLVMLFLFAAGLLLLRGGDDPTLVSETPRQTAVPGSNSQVLNSGQTQLPSQPNTAAQVQGKTIGPVPLGQFPDFVGADLASSLAVLGDNRMSYAIIEAPSASTPKGIVISQKPGAGSRSEGSTITLVVSSGPPG